MEYFLTSFKTNIYGTRSNKYLLNTGKNIYNSDGLLSREKFGLK